MTWDKPLTIIRLIDKTNFTPLGITEGGLIDGDLNNTDFFGRLVKEIGTGKAPTATLFLHIPNDGKFIRTAPILVDKDAPDKYLLEAQISQDGQLGDRQRYRISTPTITEDDDLGEVLSFPCESIAHEALNESAVSLNDELVTPKQRVINILTAHNGDGGSDKTVLTFDFSDIDIPDDESLKFDYTTTSPTTVANLLQEVLDRIKQAGPLGGVFKNFYYTTEADPLITRGVKIKFEEFGKTDSGVVIDNANDIQGIPIDKALMTSNKKRKKKVIVKFDQRSASLPMEHTEFSSKFLHAANRPEWDAGESYVEGDTVKFTHVFFTPNIIRFFRANKAVGPSIQSPDNAINDWDEDFTIIPPFNVDAFYDTNEVITRNESGTIVHYIANKPTGPIGIFPVADWDSILTPRASSSYTNFFSPTPWTADLQNFKTNLVGTTSPPAGYVGYTVDWNYERILNDIPDFTNRFLHITGKSIRDTLNDPPTGLDRKLYDGYRVRVGTSPINGFVGQANKLAEYSGTGVAGTWQFSNSPIEGDTIINLKDASIDAFQSGVWTPVWTIANNDKPSCFHLVKDIRLVKGAAGIPGQAVELRFDWKDLLLGGADNNKTSRGASACFFYPNPIEDSSSTNLGGTYGGDGIIAPNNAFINHQNLNKNSDGLVGWNREKSEDQGRISSHSFKMNLGFYRSTDDSILSKGKANIPMVYWRKDANGRFFFKDFTYTENNQWDPKTIALPPFGPTNLYFNRLDELAEIFGYTIPFDFFIPEKEFTGVKYEWRRNQSWGVFMKEMYNNTGMYVGNYKSYFDQISEAATQIFPDILEFINTLASGQPTGALFNNETTGVDHTKLRIDELHYDKEGYAIFPKTTVDDPRYDIIHLEQETDYLIATAKAESAFIENDFFPNERHVSCIGNVNITYGQLLTETGPRVPGGTSQSVCSINKETIDNRGYSNEVFLVRKFVI